jgi:tetratricopeptide (TPR) repeat protein
MAHVVAEEQRADPGEHVPDLVDSAHQLVDLDPSRALQLAERALQHCRGTDPPALAARALDVLAHARLALGRYADASTAVQEGLALSETVGDLPLRIDFLRSRLKTAFFTRDHDAAIEAGNDALQLSRQSGDRRREAIVSNDLGLVYGFLQAFDEALEHLLAGLKLLQECGEQALGSHLNNIGNIYLEQGDCAEALGFFRSACETFRVHQPGTGEAIALGNIARAHTRTGSGEEAVLAACASLELFERHAAHAYLPPALARLAGAHAVASDLIAARNRFETSLQDARIVAERLRTAVNRQPWAEVHPDLSVTVSIGIAALEGGEGPLELIAAADARLYEAKRAGRNTICA